MHYHDDTAQKMNETTVQPFCCSFQRVLCQLHVNQAAGCDPLQCTIWYVVWFALKPDSRQGVSEYCVLKFHNIPRF